MKAVITLEGEDLPIYEKGQEVKLIKRGWDMARGTVQKSTQKKLVLHADVDYACHRREAGPVINFSQEQWRRIRARTRNLV